jgi:lantibiotic modifying enzyme
MSERDLARQIWFIRASLAMLSKNAELTRPRWGVAGEKPTTADRGRLIGVACRAGARLEELALRGDGDVSWIGLTYVDQKNWALSPAGLDLYDGLPGIALFLAHLGQLTAKLVLTRSQALRWRRSAALLLRRRPPAPSGPLTVWGV